MSRAERPELGWRLLIDPPRGGALNMALDEALARSLEAGQGVLRLYRWERPTVSVGRNEPTDGWRRPGPLGGVGDGPPLAMVRRPTGGRAVLHDGEVTYALVAPLRAMGGARAAYRAVNEALVEGLRSLGASVAVAPDGAPALPLEAGPCFQAPASGEVIVPPPTTPDSSGVGSVRKLVGSAQARIGRNLLQHGSIILTGDQGRLAELCPAADDFPQPATLRELVGGVSFESVSQAVSRSIREAMGGEWERSRYSPEELEQARALVEARYGTEAWTWRR